MSEEIFPCPTDHQVRTALRQCGHTHAAIDKYLAKRKTSMAKKSKTRDLGPNLVDQTEKAVRDAINTVTGLRSVPEEQYVETVLTALELITTGLEMRKQELERTVVMMSAYEKLVRNRAGYRVFGDLDKPFHQPECGCDDCEAWRKEKGRPTHAELDKLDREGK